MPSANTLPVLTSLAALTICSGVMWLSVPIWASLPQRPQFDSCSEASAMAFRPTLMFMDHVSFLAFRFSAAILDAGRCYIKRDAVWQALTGWAELAHDPEQTSRQCRLS